MRIHLFEGALLQRQTVCVDAAFHFMEPPGEFPNSGLERAFRIDLPKPAQIHQGKEQVAQLVMDVFGIPGGQRLLNFAKFLFNFADHVGDIGPVEPHARCTCLDRFGTAQGWQLTRNPVRDGAWRFFTGALFSIDGLPVADDLVRIGDVHIAKDMRMAPDQFLCNPVRHVIESEVALL